MKYNESHRPHLLLAVVFSSLTWCSQVQGAVVSHFDGTFNLSDWTLIDQSDGPSPSRSTAIQRSEGIGGIAKSRQIDLELVAGPSWIASFSGFNAAVHDPSIDGEIDSLSFSLLWATLFNSGNTSQLAFAVLQDNTIYTVGTPGFTHVPPESPPQVFREISGEFVESDFLRVIHADSSPDFSSSGSPIQIGFVNSQVDPTPFGFNATRMHVDNFSLSITIVPEPSPLVLLVLGSSLLRGLPRQFGLSRL